MRQITDCEISGVMLPVGAPAKKAPPPLLNILDDFREYSSKISQKVSFYCKTCSFASTVVKFFQIDVKEIEKTNISRKQSVMNEYYHVP